LAKVALMVADPLAPFVVAKKPWDDEVLKARVVVPLLVVALPNWSSSWRASAVLVVALAGVDEGLGVIAACAAAPAVTVSFCEALAIDPEAVMLGVPDFVSP
jgi:hypothetical protein